MILHVDIQLSSMFLLGFIFLDTSCLAAESPKSASNDILCYSAWPVFIALSVDDFLKKYSFAVGFLL